MDEQQHATYGLHEVARLQWALPTNLAIFSDKNSCVTLTEKQDNTTDGLEIDIITFFKANCSHVHPKIVLAPSTAMSQSAQ